MDTAIFSNMILAGLFVAHLINVRTLLRHLRDQFPMTNQLNRVLFTVLCTLSVYSAFKVLGDKQYINWYFTL